MAIDSTSTLAIGLGAATRSGRRRGRVNYELLFGIVIIAIVFGMALVGPLLVQDPIKTDLLDRLLQPGTSGHLLGTDELGRDVLARLVLSARVTLSVAVPAALAAAVIGVVVGLFAGFRGGSTDQIVMRLVDAQLAYPLILLAIVVIAIFGSSWPVLVVVFTVATWAPFARVVRANTLQARRSEYVLSARVTGATQSRIMFRHILPNLTGNVVTQFNIAIAEIILLESGLSYLGLGVRPPTPTWGNMVLGGQPFISTAWWIIVLPGVCIVLTVLGFQWLGQGIVRGRST
ncbi:ABC transporter permease [Microbacterium capsulatum]|uniref:ABC transporter permease n=1 Tax=Microbacterium capsulatum TaxID=3041921 RepID=A0ABU0XD99_9MICO|nr:ABC transporter permease [Microbacterium sp. ASV81]MDQ4213083.1 ABC transporter permease [Microbacterium sp. ASV81]